MRRFGAVPPLLKRFNVSLAVGSALTRMGPLKGRWGWRRGRGRPGTYAVLRLVIGGTLGLAFTYGVGHLFGTAIG